jgi:sRNA-binding protein
MCPVRFEDVPAGYEQRIGGILMPRGRSTFTKRQKEHTRQQRQRDKAERRNQRKQEKPAAGSVDEMAELREHAAAQAALFNIGVEETEPVEESTPGGRIGE